MLQIRYEKNAINFYKSKKSRLQKDGLPKVN